MLVGTGRVRRVRRRRDLPSAYIQVYGRAAAQDPQPAPPAADADAQPAPPAADADSPDMFTPSRVTDGTRCLARTWNQGRGGQCASAPENGSDAQVCCRHRLPAQQAHGLVTGAIPAPKLAAFQKAARGARAPEIEIDSNAELPPPPGNDEFAEEPAPGENATGESTSPPECPRTPGNDAETMPGDNVPDHGDAPQEDPCTPRTENEIMREVVDDGADLFAQSDSEEYDGNVPLVPCGGCGNAKRPGDACLYHDCALRIPFVPEVVSAELPRGARLLRERPVRGSERDR